LRKGIDMKNSTLTDLFQIVNENSLSILSKDDKEIKGAEELREIAIHRTSSNKKRCHSFPINRQDFIGIESLIHQLKNSWKTHQDRFGLWKGHSEGFEGGQGEDEIT